MADYSKLEGTKVDVNTYSLIGRQDYRGVVIGCDYWVGITIVNAKNKKEYLLCLHGEKTSQARGQSPIPKGNYQRIFNFIVKQIRSGLVDIGDIDAFVNRIGRYSSQDNASAETCAFAQ